MVRSGPSRRCARASGQSALGIELNYRQGHEAKVVDHTLLPAVCRRKINSAGRLAGEAACRVAATDWRRLECRVVARRQPVADNTREGPLSRIVGSNGGTAAGPRGQL